MHATFEVLPVAGDDACCGRRVAVIAATKEWSAEMLAWVNKSSALDLYAHEQLLMHETSRRRPQVSLRWLCEAARRSGRRLIVQVRVYNSKARTWTQAIEPFAADGKRLSSAVFEDDRPEIQDACLHVLVTTNRDALASKNPAESLTSGQHSPAFHVDVLRLVPVSLVARRGQARSEYLQATYGNLTEEAWECFGNAKTDPPSERRGTGVVHGPPGQGCLGDDTEFGGQCDDATSSESVSDLWDGDALEGLIHADTDDPAPELALAEPEVADENADEAVSGEEKPAGRHQQSLPPKKRRRSDENACEAQDLRRRISRERINREATPLASDSPHLREKLVASCAATSHARFVHCRLPDQGLCVLQLAAFVLRRRVLDGVGVWVKTNHGYRKERTLSSWDPRPNHARNLPTPDSTPRELQEVVDALPTRGPWSVSMRRRMAQWRASGTAPVFTRRDL